MSQNRKRVDRSSDVLPSLAEHGVVADLAAEEAVIGACLLTAEVALEFVALGVQEDWFVAPMARAAWAAIQALVAAGVPVDEVTVGGRMLAQGWVFQSAGDLAYFTARVDSTAHARFWLEAVRKCWAQRSAVAAAVLAMEGLRVPAASAEEVAERVLATAARFSDLAAQGQKRSERVVAAQVGVKMEALLAGKKTFPEHKLVSHGLEMLDDHTDYIHHKVTKPLGPMTPGELVILAARPSVGKSSLVRMIMGRALLGKHRQRVACYSLEMAMDEVILEMAAARNRVSLDPSVELKLWMNADMSRHHRVEKMRGEVDQLVKLSGERFFFRDGAVTVDDLVSHARWAYQRGKGLDLIVVDYLQLLEGSQDGRANWKANRQEEIAKISRTLKTLAMELDCVVVALSQLNRDADDENGPKLVHLRESGAIEQDADRVYFLFTTEKDANGTVVGAGRKSKPVMFRVGKQRRGARDWDLPLNFEGETKLFFGVPKEEHRGRPPKNVPVEKWRADQERKRIEELQAKDVGNGTLEQEVLGGLGAPEEDGPPWPDDSVPIEPF